MIDVIEFGKLVETQFGTKKDFMLYMKSFLKATKKHLEANNPDRVEGFMASAAAATKKLVGQFKDLEFFLGPSCNPDGSMGIMTWGDDGNTPTMFFFADNLKEVKL